MKHLKVLVKRTISLNFEIYFFSFLLSLAYLFLLIYFFPSSQTKKTHEKKTHASVTVTVIRDRKIRTALRTNHIVGFVTVPTCKKIQLDIVVKY